MHTKLNIILGVIVLGLGIFATILVSHKKTLSFEKLASLPEHNLAFDQNLDHKTLKKNNLPLEDDAALITDDFRIKGAHKTIHTEDFMDWRVDCADTQTSVNHYSSCTGFQNLVDAKDRKSLLLVSMNVLSPIAKNYNPKAQIKMRLRTPANISVKDGMRLNIEGTKSSYVAFQQCSSDACYINIILDKSVVEALKNKDSFLASYRKNTDEIVDIPISLHGFTEALRRMGQS